MTHVTCHVTTVTTKMADDEDADAFYYYFIIISLNWAWHAHIIYKFKNNAPVQDTQGLT